MILLPAGLALQVIPGGGPPGPTYSPWDVSSLPSNVVASDGNFTLTRSGGANSTRIVNHPVTRTSGKYAVRLDVRRDNLSSAPAIGVRNGSTGAFLGETSAGWALYMDNSGSNDNAFHSNSGTNLGDLGSSSSNIEVMMELDLDNGRLWFGVAGTWALSGNPATGANPIYTDLSGTIILCADMYYDGGVKLKVPADFNTPASSGFTAGWPD